MNKIILFELNEVPVKILNHYLALRPTSALAQIVEHSRKFESYTENKGHLSPWNTWPTLHRGVNNEKHLIHDFGQNLDEVDQEFPPIWQILANNGISVGMFGSLHSYPLPKKLDNYAFYVPDVFASGPECHPKAVEVFQNFNLTLSRESIRNVSKRTPLGDGFKLLANIGSLGLRLDTLAQTASQVVQEKLSPWKTVRRRTFQSVLSFDVFMKQLQDKKPDFVTYFTNHVASSMHRFWAASFPEEYNELPYDEDWLRTYHSEILFTMDATDRMLSRLKQFIDRNPEYKLIVASSMGQNAVEPKAVHTSLFVKNADRFMQSLQLSKDAYSVKPAMFPQFNVEMLSAADTLEEKLKTLKIKSIPIGYRRFDNTFSIDLGHEHLTDSDPVIEFNHQHYTVEEFGLENVKIEDRCGASAYHIPEGTLLVYHPSLSATKNEGFSAVSTEAILPSLLKNFNLKQPDYTSQVNQKEVAALLG